MDNVRHVIEVLLQFIIDLGGIIVAAIMAVEVWMRGLLTQFGVPAQIQTVLLIALAVVLIIAALRLFGGFIRIAFSAGAVCC